MSSLKSYFAWENFQDENYTWGKGIIRFDHIQEIQVVSSPPGSSPVNHLAVWLGPEFRKAAHKFPKHVCERFYREYQAWLEHKDALKVQRSQPPYIETVNLS